MIRRSTSATSRSTGQPRLERPARRRLPRPRLSDCPMGQSLPGGGPDRMRRELQQCVGLVRFRCERFWTWLGARHVDMAGIAPRCKVSPMAGRLLTNAYVATLDDAGTEHDG